MNLDTLLPSAPLTKGEEADLKTAFSHPVVKKYLKLLGVEDSKDLLSLNILDMPDKDIANRHHFISGKLAVISTLMAIASLPNPAKE
jgi:hypothetical protein